MAFSLSCVHCTKSFVGRYACSKVCSPECCVACELTNEVVRTCEVCGNQFVLPYKFRNIKTCGKVCQSARASRLLKTSVIKQCLACGGDFSVIRSCVEQSKYCSYDPCFLSTRQTRQPDIEKTCEWCGKKFTVPYTKRTQRFCGYSCANTGPNNGMYGKPGSMLGRKAWNNGLTVETDARLAALGRKVSLRAKEAFKNGERTHTGAHNPMFGHTADLNTPAQRSNYSRAAVARVMAGVSGYKTGHLTGSYSGLKCSEPVRFKSSWELAAMLWWDQSPDIEAYAYEPTVFDLDDGRRAVPDFLLTYRGGRMTYVEIKPTAIQALSQVADRLGRVRIAVERLGMSYELLGNAGIDRYKRELGEVFNDAVKCYQGGSTYVRHSVPV